MVARIGTKQSRVAIQKYTTTRSPQGATIRAFVTEKTVWARVNPIGGAERNQVDRVEAVRSHVVTMRFYSPGIDESARLVHKGRIYNIVKVVNPGERGVETVLDVKEEVIAT